MKAFTKTITAFALAGLTLLIVVSFSAWLGVAFLMIFAPDLASVVVADYRRTQRQRLVAGFNAVAARTSAALRLSASAGERRAFPFQP